MIKQIFRLIWKRRKSNFLLIFQLFVSFLALSVFTTINIEKFSNYFRPYSFEYKNVWAIYVQMQGIPKDRAVEYVRTAKLKLKAIPGTEIVANGSLRPFSSFGEDGRVDVNGQKHNVRDFIVDENHQKALKLILLKGRWFKKEDYNSAIKPVVISRDFSEEYFKDEDPLGKEFLYNDKKVRVLGVSETYRDNYSSRDFFDIKGTMFLLPPADTVYGSFLLRSHRVADFLVMEEQIRKALSSIKDEKFIIRSSSPLPMVKKSNTKMDLIQLTLALLIVGFLILNIFLGISGVFSYSISKRKPEIGLRVTAGAVRGDIVKQFLAETIMLTTFAIIPGALISFQFFVTGFLGGSTTWKEQLIGFIASALFIYLLTISCSLYPSLRASKIQPAEALHEE